MSLGHDTSCNAEAPIFQRTPRPQKCMDDVQDLAQEGRDVREQGFRLLVARKAGSKLFDI